MSRFDKLMMMFVVATVSLQPCATADSCPEIPPIQHAEIKVSDGPPYKEGTTVEIKCDKGFKGYGTPTVTCLKNSRWSDSFPHCRALQCRRDMSQIESGQKCRKRCKTDGDCRGEFKKCVCDDWCGLSCFNPDAKCPDLKAPENGYILGTKFSYGYKVTYGCKDGFTLNGHPTRKCQSDKTWSGYEPKCLSFRACGISGAKDSNDIKGNVIDGNDASEAAWPWQALLFHSGNHKVAQIYNPHSSFGGGSVIDNKWILTAAHIFDQFIRNNKSIIWKQKFLIVLGMTSYPKQYHVIPDHVHIFEPQQLYRHKEYEPKTFDYDVALIRIGKRLKRNGETFIVDSNARDQLMEFSRHIRPVCLPCVKSDPTSGTSDILKDFNSEKCSSRGRSSLHNFVNSGDKAVVTGFGYHIDPRWNVQVKPTVLQEGLVEIQDDNTCVDGVRRMPGENARYTDVMICAESADKSLQTDACQGDSGGPLVKQFQTSDQSTYWIQVGIVSWGYKCKRNFPGYYSSVSSIISWVRDTIKSSETSFTEWSTWSRCSTTCGAGKRSKYRRCLGEIGSCKGDQIQTVTCNENKLCPRTDKWQKWGECSVSCGIGIRTRTRRSCRNKTPGDLGCERADFQRTRCVEKACGIWSLWGLWSACSKSCNRGFITRTRVCNGGTAGSGGCLGLRNDKKPCNTHDCSSWGAWVSWTPCDVTCGVGISKRARACENGIPGHGGCIGEFAQERNCRTQNCARWSDWAQYTVCGKTCGYGIRQRERQCLFGEVGDSGCVGDAIHWKVCNNRACDFWSSWSSWTACDQLCDGGRTVRTRTCINGVAGEGGCRGSERDTNSCNMNPCARWLGWLEWTSCTVTCGGGERARSRLCVGGIPGEFGCQGDLTEKELCNLKACDFWSSWSPWSACDQLCNGGRTVRTRTCINGVAGEGGCIGSERDTNSCNMILCAGWASWSEWTLCTVSCGGGERRKDRGCNGGKLGELGCQGAYAERESCNMQTCLKRGEIGEWASWTKWSPCTRSCGRGSISRIRICIGGNSGQDGCKGPDSEIDDCYIAACLERDEMSKWTSWSQWSTCSRSCGGGVIIRTRFCIGGNPGQGGCKGPVAENILCKDRCIG